MPPLVEFNVLHLLSTYSLFAIMFYYKGNRVSTFMRSGLCAFSVMMLIAVVYLTIVLMVTTGQYVLLYGYFVLLSETVVCSLYLLLYCEKKDFGLHELLIAFLLAGVVQALIAFAAYSSSEIQEVLLNLISRGGLSDRTVGLASHRLYGFGNWLTFSTPVFQTYLSIIAMMMFIEGRKWSVILIPILLMSAIINARTSLVVFAIGVLCVMVSLVSRKKALKFITAIFVIFILFLFSLMLSSDNPAFLQSENWLWVNEGFYEIALFLQGDRVGYFNTLLSSDFLRLPDGVSIIFGTGASIVGLLDGSDVGYINDIWIGGLLFVLFAYSSCILLFAQSIWSVPTGRTLQLFIISSFLIVNIKGTVLYPNEIMHFSILCSAFLNISRFSVNEYFAHNVQRIRAI